MGVVPIQVDIMARADHGDGGLDPPGPMGTAAVPAGTAVLAAPVTYSVEDPILADTTARIDTDRPVENGPAPVSSQIMGRASKALKAGPRMNEQMLAGVLFFVLCGAGALGSYVRARLPEKHRSSETMGLVQVTISLLVTFTSIVLGLLTGAVTTEFQQASRNDGVFAGQLVQVDQCLRDYGPETARMRQQFRGYVAAVLTSTWPDESPPEDISHPDVSKDPVLGEGVSLTTLLNTIRTELRELSPKNAIQERVLTDCAAEFSSFLKSRWDIVEESTSSISPPFYGVLSIWLVILFASFGLIARPNPVSRIIITLSALSIAVAVGVIADLDQPYGGAFSIPSAATRNALADMVRSSN